MIDGNWVIIGLIVVLWGHAVYKAHKDSKEWAREYHNAIREYHGLPPLEEESAFDHSRSSK